MLSSIEIRLTKLCENDRKVLMHYYSPVIDSPYHTFLSESCVLNGDTKQHLEIDIHKAFFINSEGLYPLR